MDDKIKQLKYVARLVNEAQGKINCACMALNGHMLAHYHDLTEAQRDRLRESENAMYYVCRELQQVIYELTQHIYRQENIISMSEYKKQMLENGYD